MQSRLKITFHSSVCPLRPLCPSCSLGPPLQGPQGIPGSDLTSLENDFQVRENQAVCRIIPKIVPVPSPPAPFHPVQGGPMMHWELPALLPYSLQRARSNHTPRQNSRGDECYHNLTLNMNASDCLLNCSSKRKYWQANIIKMEAKEML